ncbi:helix-turn-helix transcriptional regulator [Oscillochloris sp. ZM17-4]|nr:helix-turn-helix transcriptional regulator [Oscillochloris sp. ZM17-4]
MLREELARRFPHWVEPLRRCIGEPQPRSIAPPARRAPATALIEPLSGREREILDLMEIGCSNRDIAARLSIVEGTVKTHVKHIFGKLGARNRTEAVAIARSLQIIA